MVEKMNQTCSTLIRAGVLGCRSLLHEIASDLLPAGVPATFRVNDICEASCGLCVGESLIEVISR